MPVTARVDDREVRIGLGELRAGVADRSGILKIVGDLMTASIARTFRGEGSPAGSWPALAVATLRSKKYKGIHKLLVLSGRLFRSISYAVEGDTLTIGTNVAYAGVHQFGSADRRGGSIGPQARVAGRSVKVGAYTFAHAYRASSGDKYGTIKRQTAEGFPIKGKRRKLISGVSIKQVTVGEHRRYQNIPARPYLVFRPEDPARFVSGIEAYLGGRAVRIGKVATA